MATSGTETRQPDGGRTQGAPPAGGGAARRGRSVFGSVAACDIFGENTANLDIGTNI